MSDYFCVAAPGPWGAAACTLLAWLGWLKPPILVGVLLALTIVPSLVRRRRFRVRIRPRAARWWAGVGIGLLLAIGLVVLSSGVDLSGRRLPFSSTVWYYANLARAVAETGGFPATSVDSKRRLALRGTKPWNRSPVRGSG